MPESRFILRKIASDEQRELTGITSVGREVTAGLKLIEESASRRHASLSVSDGTVHVEDAGSRNGTFVNGSPVTRKTALRSGDRIRFDKEEFEFWIENSAPIVDDAPPAEEQPVPGAMVDWNNSGSNGTERLTSDQLAEFLLRGKLRQAEDARNGFKEPCLTVTSGAQAERVVPLTGIGGTREWTIGRAAECAIRFDEADISQWHAKLVREGRQWRLIDAISSNGTFVNDLRIGMSGLSSGDCLRFGRVECVFHLPGMKTRAAQGVTGRAFQDGMNRKKALLVAASASLLMMLVALYFVFFKAGRS